MTYAIALLVLLAGLVPASANAQSVYRCKGAQGETVFQQAPCAKGQGAAVEIPPSNVVESQPAGEAGLRAAVSRPRIGGSGLQQGMSDDELMRVLGQPSTVNTDYINGRVSRQYVYQYPDGSTRYVYTRDGALYAVQNRPSVAPTRAERCYSDLEIRNAEVGSTSVNLPPDERAKRRARADEMRRCRR
jgi:hypothetical protein